MLLRHCQTKEADEQTCIPYDHRATSRLHSGPATSRRTHRPDVWQQSIPVNQNQKNRLYKGGVHVCHSMADRTGFGFERLAISIAHGF